MDITFTALCKLLFVVIYLTSDAGGQYAINMHQSASRLRQGQNVTLTCNVTNERNTSVLMYWVKKFEHEEEEIGTGNHLSEYYRKTNRYTIAAVVVQQLTKFKFTLTIIDAKSSDSGAIECRIPNQNIKVFRTITVLSQAESVKLSSEDLDNTHGIVYTHKQRVDFTEGDVRKFCCHVNGSYPKPHVTVMIGDENITDSFNETAFDLQKNLGAVRSLFYKVTLCNPALKIGYKYSGKNLTCSAHVRDTTSSTRSHDVVTSQAHNRDHDISSNYPTVNASIAIILSGYRPKFLCQQEVLATLYQSEVDLNCVVQAQPPATKGKFHFKRHTKGNVTIETGSVFASIRGILTNSTNPGHQQMTLHIDHVSPQHFRTYYFEAENAEGSTIHQMELRKDPLAPVKSGSSSTSSTSLTVGIIFLLYLSFLNLTRRDSV